MDKDTNHYENIDRVITSMEKYHSVKREFDFEGQKRLWSYLDENKIRIVSYKDLWQRYEDVVNKEHEHELLRIQNE